jgi:CheY-like chemotaxis protein
VPSSGGLTEGTFSVATTFGPRGRRRRPPSADALQLALTRELDLAGLDVSMPKLTGLQGGR